jgi:hypothetical protein
VGDFKSLRDTNVLVYFPHGFGDFVQILAALPLLNATNRYWITRLGDDYTCVMEGNAVVTPVYTGFKAVMREEGRSCALRTLGAGPPDVRKGRGACRAVTRCAAVAQVRDRTLLPMQERVGASC